MISTAPMTTTRISTPIAAADAARESPSTESSPKFEQPRMTRPLTWPGPMLVDDAKCLKTYAAGLTKMAVISPCTLALRLVDEHYGSLEKLTYALADVLNQESTALEAAGVDLIQIDEPEVHFRYSQLKDFAVDAINRAVAGVRAQTAVHTCYGYSKNSSSAARPRRIPSTQSICR